MDWFGFACKDLRDLCAMWDLEAPVILLDESDEDRTEAGCVWFGRLGNQEDPMRVKHVFGHWVCDLHAGSNAEKQDRIADKIGAVAALVPAERRRVKRDEIWTRKDGRTIAVEDMSEEHVRSALRMMIRRDRRDRDDEEWAERMAELAYCEVMSLDEGDRR